MVHMMVAKRVEQWDLMACLMVEKLVDKMVELKEIWLVYHKVELKDTSLVDGSASLSAERMVVK